MNVAFICTGEFEPFFYDCMGKQLEKDGISVFYFAFYLDTRLAIKDIGRKCYPESLNVAQIDVSDAEKTLFSKEELEQIVEYDYLRLKANGVSVNRERLIAQALSYERNIKAFLDKYNIEAIVMWNAFPILVNTAWRIADKKHIKKIFFENGLLFNTLMIDKEGVNFQSELAKKDKDFYEKIPFSSEKWEAFVSFYKKNRTIPYKKNKGILSYWKKLYLALLMRNPFYKNSFPDLIDDEISISIHKKIFSDLFIKEKDIELPDKFVFLPLQYSGDTQVLVNSSNVKDMKELVEICYKAAKSVLPDGYKVVVKEHPDDMGRLNYDALIDRYPDIIWLKKYDVRKLISRSSLVITVNSSVGVEALMYHKPVITLGKSLYNIESVVYHVDELSKLGDTIKSGLEKPLNIRLIDKFLYYLRFEYLVEGSPRYCEEESLREAYNRVKKILLQA